MTYETASRNGEPFDALIKLRNMLPNPVTRFCTQDLKINAIQRWSRSMGLGKADRVLGLRADEQHRVARIRAREATGKDACLVRVPLVSAGVTKADISEFWRRQNFDLRLPNVKGKTPLGNCDLCFLKSAATISGIMRVAPHLADWWVKTEAAAPGLDKVRNAGVALFRKDRPSYAAMLKAVQDSGPGFDFGDVDELNDCYCTGDA